MNRCRWLRIAGFFTVIAASTLLAIFALPPRAAHAIPTTMNFQGRLMDSAGNIKADGLYNMKFAIYTVASGGTAAWSETREVSGTDYRIQLTNGLFSTQLGQRTPLPASLFANTDLYFEITMATPATATCNTTSCQTWEAAMPTRQKLAASAYAFQAENANYATTAGTATTASNADTVDGLHAAAFGQLDGTNTWTGTNLFKPTTNSATALQVQNAAGAVVLGVNTIAGTTILGSLAADPTAPNSTNGALYYNTATNKLRCYENGAWANCAASAANVIQNQYASLQTANYFIQSANNTTAAATIQAASGQTGAVFRVLDSGGTARFWVNGVGDFQTATQNNNLGGLQIGGTYGAHTSMLDIITRSAATTGLTIKASTSQTAPLIVLQDSTGTEVARINADGSNNTAFGKISLQNNPGSGNTAFGALTLSQQTSGINNTALGYNAMGNGAVTAQNNTGVGVSSLQTITSGSANTGIGAQAGFSLTTGDANTALGFQTLLYNQTGERNVAIGYQALSGTNTTAGTGNIGIGYLTGNVLTSGDYNIMIGDAAGQALVSGSSNTFIGDFAGYNDGGFMTAATLQRATAIGVEAVVQQDNSMVLGSIGTTTRVGIGTTKPAELLSVAPAVYNTGTASATTAGTVTGTGTTWTNGNNVYVGDTIIFANGVSGTITAINSATSLTISPNPAAAVANQYYRIHRGGFNVKSNGDTYIKQISSTAFQVQNAGGVSLLTADTANSQVVIGSGGNTLTLSPATGVSYAGTARKTKKITLPAEYAGAVLDAASDASCSAAYNGTMTAAYDSANRMNSYVWTSTQATNQCFDVVVQVPIPSDFSAWAASDSINIKMKTNDAANSAYAIQIVDSAGTTDANYNYSAPGTVGTSWADMATQPFSGTYTAGDYLTIKLRMTAKNSAQLQAGNIVLTYLSSF